MLTHILIYNCTEAENRLAQFINVPWLVSVARNANPAWQLKFNLFGPTVLLTAEHRIPV